jgi:hypothetical protein
MTVSEFIDIWGRDKPDDISQSNYPGQQIITVTYRDYSRSIGYPSRYPEYLFTFTNGNLASWHEF